jgi:hypothetical protein
MDINTRTFENNFYRPFYVQVFSWIFEVLPPPNTIKGIFAYTFFIYIIVLIIRIISIKFGKLDEEENSEVSNLKQREEMCKKLEETRKKRSDEANKLLEKIQ